ncbi:MAG TPA: lysylphosphatidylglycerol synthase transmembrane domain-containing protein [Candidatus Saccharimonadales bacterium]|nr:lysylphosphatidylglycerol synthase transmembrane domain-containing protein [Candidatus Saccharimonadales bacterium]
MSEQSWTRHHWKTLVNIITAGALLLLIVFTRKQIGSTIHDLKHVHAWALLLLIPIEAINYHAQAKIYQRLFEIVGNKLPYKYLYRAALELNFVNHVFPSGGVTGLSYFSLRVRSGKALSSGKATLVHIMKVGLYLLAFEVLLIFGVFALAIMGRVNNLVILVSSSLLTLLLVGTVMFFYIIGSKRRINSFFTGATKIINWVIHLFLRRYPETISIDGVRFLFEDIHENYSVIKKNYRRLQAPFWYSLLADGTEIMAVYMVYIAFGKLVNVGAVILAYGIANFAGLISVMPGGVGIYETLMVGVLASTGIPPGVSLPVTVMYRVLNTLVQIPPGYYLYHRNLKRTA